MVTAKFEIVLFKFTGLLSNIAVSYYVNIAQLLECANIVIPILATISKYRLQYTRAAYVSLEETRNRAKNCKRFKTNTR